MKHRINLLKKTDAIFGPLLLKRLPKAKYKKKPENIKQILIIRPGGMGDAALLIPVLKEIKLKYPIIKINILCESRNAGIFTATPFVDEIFLYHNPVSMLHLYSQTNDIIFDTEQSHFLSALICRILKSRYRVGFDINGRGRLFNLAIQYKHELYEVTSFQNLFKCIFNISETALLNPPYFKQEEKSTIIGEILNHRNSEKIVCLFTGATIDERLWLNIRWAETVDSLSNSGCLVILLGGNMEKKQCRNIKSLCKESNVFNMTGRLSLLETSWLFSKSNLLISTDSGILHLGVLSNVSTISLFGSGIEEKWAPKGDRHLVINKNLDCSPCTLFGTTPECPNKNACMMSIQSNDIIEAARKLLSILE